MTYRAVERVASLEGAKNWELVNKKEIMQMLAEDIRVQASLKVMKGKHHSLPSITKKEISYVKKVKGKETPHSSHSISPESSLVVSDEQSTTTTFVFFSKNNKEPNPKLKTNQSDDALPHITHHAEEKMLLRMILIPFSL